MHADAALDARRDLGGVESLLVPPGPDDARVDGGARRRAGLAPIRLSVGIEEADDLVADLEQALVRSPVPPVKPLRLEPIDLRHQGDRAVIGVYLARDRGGPGALRLRARPSCIPALERRASRNAGLELTDIRHLLLSHIHLDHAGAAGRSSASTPTFRCTCR